MKTDKQEPELTLVGGEGHAGEHGRLRGRPRDITIAGLWRTFRSGLWLIAATVLLAVLAAGVVLKTRVPIYEAGMTVAPAARDFAAAGQVAAELEGYAGFATLAQTGVEIERVSTLDRYLVMLTSTKLAEDLAGDREIMAGLFGPQFDPETGDWRPPNDIGSRIKRIIFDFFGFPGWQEPGPAQIADRLSDRLGIRGSNGIYRLTLSGPDPAFAVRLLGTMHAAANEILREEALVKIRSQIDEIEARLANGLADEPRQALETLIGSHYGNEAMLAAEESFAAEMIDPPSTSGWPTSTSPILTLGLALVVGTIVGLFIVFLRDALRALAD